MDYITSVEQILAKGAPFPPAGQVSMNARQTPGRLDIMGTNKLLFDGKSGEIYADWTRMVVGEGQDLVELVVNFQRRLSKLWKSLLLTEVPIIKVNKEAQEWVDNLVKTSRLMAALGSVVIDQSRWGAGLLKVSDRTGEGAIQIKAQPAYIGDGKNHAGGWFPIVDPMDLQEVTAHVLAWMEYRREAVLGIPVIKKYLHAEVHTRGFVQTQLWTMDGNTVKILVEDSTVATGYDGFLLSPVHNGLTSDCPTGTDDYQDLDSLLHEVEIRLSQLSRILDKHSDPNLQGPAHMMGNASPGQVAAQAQAQGKHAPRAAAQGPQVRMGGRFFGLNQDDPKVEYVTWDPRVEGIKWQVETLMDLVYLLSETSQAAFGQQKTGMAESGSALRRLLMAPLLKVADMRTALNDGLTDALFAANALARANGQGVPLLTSVDTEWQDGLPADMVELANVETAMHAAELTSREASITRVYGLTGDGLKDELKKIDTQKKADAPEPVSDADAILAAARAVPPVAPAPVIPDPNTAEPEQPKK